MNEPRVINPYRAFVGAWVPNWLMERPEVSAGAKLTYGRLAQHAGRDGICKPRQEVLAAELGIGARQIRRYLDELQDNTLIREQRMGRGQANRYDFLEHPWMGGDSPPAAHDRTEVSSQDEWTDTTSQTVEWSHVSGPERTDMSGHHIRNRKESKKRNNPPRNDEEAAPFPDLTLVSPPARPVSDVERIWKLWQEATGKHQAKLDPKRHRAIEKALKSHGFDVVAAAVQGWRRDPWPDRPRHNDVTVLLRDADHIEKFAELHEHRTRAADDGPPAINADELPMPTWMST